MRVVGQCKKYTTPVQIGGVKEFVETLQVVKYRGEPKIERLVPPWFHAVRGPIIGLIIAHTNFQSGADTKARNHGIVVADSLDLAEVIALSRHISETLTAAARADACMERVRNILEGSVVSSVYSAP